MSDVLNSSTDSYVELHQILLRDVLDVREQLKSDSQSQLARRNYIRTLFALIEGDTFSRKQVALAIYQFWLSSRKTIFTLAELALLRDEQYYLNNGRAKQQQLFLKVEDNLRFSLEILAKAYGSLRLKATTDFKLDCSVKEWGLFKETIKCRNRITHPRRVCDLDITDKEVQDTDAVLRWYTGRAFKLWDEIKRNNPVAFRA